MNWISTKDQLPEEGKYVLARHNRGFGSDDRNSNCVVVRLIKGLSKIDRSRMVAGELENPEEEVWFGDGYLIVKRSALDKEADETGNNLKPYIWKSSGGASFFGQDIIYWTLIYPV